MANGKEDVREVTVHYTVRFVGVAGRIGSAGDGSGQDNSQYGASTYAAPEGWDLKKITDLLEEFGFKLDRETGIGRNIG